MLAILRGTHRRAPAQCFLQHFRHAHRSVGIIGMPNVGKSTLFNALTQTQRAQAENYPFCTIEPNIARVAVPDARLQRLASTEHAQRVVSAQLEFVDIAGLVRGASRGLGLGNTFLEHIRRVAVLVHVVRCFSDDNVIHVEQSVDPVRDLETIRTELLLADLQTIEKRLARPKQAASAALAAGMPIVSRKVLERLQQCLEVGQMPYAAVDLEDAEQCAQLESLQLLSAKPTLVVCNVAETDAASGNAMTHAVHEQLRSEQDQQEKGHAGHGPVRCVVISAALEDAAASFEDAESQLEYLQASGWQETGLTKIIRESHAMLDLHTFYTASTKEARAWQIRAGATAVQAASVIHSDFEKLFIRAETIAYADWERAGSIQQAKALGLQRAEGKDYVVADGDIMHFLVTRG